jgi:PAS domain S-box-containing protein
MNSAESQLRGVGDPRLAVHATGNQPVWLWSLDGTRVLWANPVGARLFGARNAAALSAKIFGPADPHRRQLAQLSGRLPQNGATRLERLRGFGAAFGGLMTCACARLGFADGGAGVLVIATQRTGPAMPLTEQLRNLIEGIETPIAAFARDGVFIGASDAARTLLGFHNLSGAGFDTARGEALKDGRVETPIGIGHMVLQRVGSGADVGLIALIAPNVVHATPAAASEPDATQPDQSAGTFQTAFDETTDAVEAPRTSEASEQTLVETAPVVVAEVDPALVDSVVASAAVAEAEPDPEAGALHHDVAPEQAAALPRDVDYVTASHQVHEAITAPADDGAAAHGIPVISAIEFGAETTAFEAAIAESITHAEPIADVQPSTHVAAAHAPSLHVEAVADQPATLDTVADPAAIVPPSHGDTDTARKNPLRFLWQMDADGRFSLGSDEFTRLIGARTAAGFGRPWAEIVDAFDLDPEGLVAKAVATRNTWSGITLLWPVDGGARLPVELSGLPVTDRAHAFAGYRGFGVCRDLEGMARLATLRRHELQGGSPPRSLSADVAQAGPVGDAIDEPISLPAEQKSADPLQTIETDTAVDTPKNVVPFRPGDLRSPALTPVENNAFNELARQLSARLDAETALTSEAAPSPLESEELLAQLDEQDAPASASEATDWLSSAPVLPHGETMRDKVLLDLMPVGVLIYRRDRLLYANPAFLARMGFASLHALEDAGGLGALSIEPDVAANTSDGGTAVTIAIASSSPAPRLTDARLFTIAWDGDRAMALIFAQTRAEPPALASAVEDIGPGGQADAEELGAILDTTTEGILMFDAEGNINSCNRSAEALFGYDGAALTQRNLVDLFAPESQRVISDYLNGIKSTSGASLLDHGREALGRVREGGLLPLSVMMGRTRQNGPNFFAVFRDLTQAKKTEAELLNARRQADRAATAKADVLARISHEVRTPLNAIIGFAEVMTDERFGPLGNERYVDYMKDIRSSGERVIAIINDLLDLSRIETGKLDLAFANQNLNEMVEQCVAVMQPQANRGRIIIRTSLAHLLPAVSADARALRQIALNLIGNSIHLANAGGQVIVSTALTDYGEVVLRVRDTGHSMNDNELAAAMEPFNSQAPADHASENAGVSLSLTKALVEANRARFQIKTAPHSGTLIEVLFAGQVAAKA